MKLRFVIAFRKRTGNARRKFHHLLSYRRKKFITRVASRYLIFVGLFFRNMKSTRKSRVASRPTYRVTSTASEWRRPSFWRSTTSAKIVLIHCAPKSSKWLYLYFWCNYLDTEFHKLVEHPCMTKLKARSVFIHVELPGQEYDAPDLSENFTFPSIQDFADDLIHVLDFFKYIFIVP